MQRLNEISAELKYRKKLFIRQHQNDLFKRSVEPSILRSSSQLPSAMLCPLLMIALCREFFRHFSNAWNNDGFAIPYMVFIISLIKSTIRVVPYIGYPYPTAEASVTSAPNSTFFAHSVGIPCDRSPTLAHFNISPYYCVRVRSLLRTRTSPP